VSARDEMLARVRKAMQGRGPAGHLGPFGSWRPAGVRPPAPAEQLVAMLQAAGAEVVSVPDESAGLAWLARFSLDFAAATLGATLPAALRPSVPHASPDTAPLGISLARGAIAETGSLLLDARDGRRAQLLPPTHVVFVRIADVHATFRDAALDLKDDLPSAIGLHSGPSKSADIGQVMVKGVHGPGRLVAVILGTPSPRST
jgi:L-lactate dehydrogenase complex protein LldG